MDKSEYILIKGDTYTMGETRRKVTVPDLYFARYPVTNRLYREFMKATGHYGNGPDVAADVEFGQLLTFLKRG